MGILEPRLPQNGSHRHSNRQSNMPRGQERGKRERVSTVEGSQGVINQRHVNDPSGSVAGLRVICFWAVGQR